MSTVGKPIQCRAAVSWGKKKDLTIETITVDPPKDHEVRIKIVAAGVCFSDIHINEGNNPLFNFPVVLGHEATGIVESVGEKVTLVKPGDAVIPLWNYQCGKCHFCLKKKRNVCLEGATYAIPGVLPDKTTRMTCKGQTLYQCLMVAAFSEYTVVPEMAVAKLKPNTPLEKVAPYGCCMPTGYGAVTKTAKVEPDSTVVVVGLGAIGLSAVLGARDAKASKIIGVDTNPDKKEIGEKFGITDFVNPKDHPNKKTSDIIKEMTGGLGADFIFVCVGSKAVVEDSLSSVRMGGGEVIIVGIVDDPPAFSVTDILFGKTVKGTWCGDFHCRTDLPLLVDDYMAGKFPTDLLITHTLPLERINEAFELLKKGKSIRTIIKFD